MAIDVDVEAFAPHVIFHEGRVMAVHKPAGVSSEDVARALGHKLVHRIDAPTSGLLLLAEDARTVQRMQRVREAGGLVRVYRFVCHGVVAAQTLRSRLGRDRGDGLRGSVEEGGAVAVTEVEPLWRGELHGAAVSGGVARLGTGRTHQIRIQLAERGYPIVGDRVYVRDRAAAGLPILPSSRLMLHAWRLQFVHPNTHAPVALEAPLPPGFDASEPA